MCMCADGARVCNIRGGHRLTVNDISILFFSSLVIDRVVYYCYSCYSFFFCMKKKKILCGHSLASPLSLRVRL